MYTVSIWSKRFETGRRRHSGLEFCYVENNEKYPFARETAMRRVSLCVHAIRTRFTSICTIVESGF